MQEDLSIIYKTKRDSSMDESLLHKTKDKILGKKYILSIVFVGTTEMRKLNRTYRDKDYATDVLSFAIEDNTGEIIICEKISAGKAKLFGRTPEEYLFFLFIHAMLHLKGMLHGSRMESEEKKWLKKLK